MTVKQVAYIFILSLCFLSSCQDFDKRKYVTKHVNLRDTRNVYPFFTGDVLRQISDHIVDDTHVPFYSDKVKQGDIIFLKTKYIRRFVKYMHPKIKNPYILITHNGDEEVPGEYEYLLRDKKILIWFGMNVTKTHPKLISLPIGFGSKKLARIVTELSSENIKKERLLYLNFKNTHPEREEIKTFFSTKPFCFIDTIKPYSEYVKEIKRSKFTISPRGNGIDCHRVWESIFLGTIPVIKSCALDSLYADLPIVIVKEWSEVTEAFLQEKYSEIMAQEYCLEKLYADYWLKLIGSYAKRAFSTTALLEKSKTPTYFNFYPSCWSEAKVH